MPTVNCDIPANFGAAFTGQAANITATIKVGAVTKATLTGSWAETTAGSGAYVYPQAAIDAAWIGGRVEFSIAGFPSAAYADSLATVTGLLPGLQSFVNVGGAAAPPSTIIGVLTTRDASGNAVPHVPIYFQCIKLPDSQASDSFDGDWFPITSDGAGLLQYPFTEGATYNGKTAKGAYKEFTVPTTGSSFNLPAMLGRYNG